MEVFFCIGFVDIVGNLFGVVGVGLDLLVFFVEDGGGVGVLVEGEDVVGGDFGVFEECECDVVVVGGGFGVVEDGGDLGEVFWVEVKGIVVYCLLCEEGEGFGGDFEDFFVFEGGGGDVFFGK